MELDFSGLAVAGFDGVYQTGANVGRESQAVGEDEDRLREVEFEQRLRGRELHDSTGFIRSFLRGSLLVQTVVSTAAEFDQAIFDRVSDGGGCDVLGGLLRSCFGLLDWRRGFGFAGGGTLQRFKLDLGAKDRE